MLLLRGPSRRLHWLRPPAEGAEACHHPAGATLPCWLRTGLLWVAALHLFLGASGGRFRAALLLLLHLAPLVLHVWHQAHRGALPSPCLFPKSGFCLQALLFLKGLPLGWASWAAAFGLLQFGCCCCCVIQFSCQAGENAVWIDRASQELILGYQTQDSGLGQRQHHHCLRLGPGAGKPFHALHHPAELQHLQEGEKKGNLASSNTGFCPETHQPHSTKLNTESHRFSGHVQRPARSPGIAIYTSQPKFHCQKAATVILLSGNHNCQITYCSHLTVTLTV